MVGIDILRDKNAANLQIEYFSGIKLEIFGLIFH